MSDPQEDSKPSTLPPLQSPSTTTAEHASEPVIDPELADLPAPPHHNTSTVNPEHGHRLGEGPSSSASINIDPSLESLDDHHDIDSHSHSRLPTIREPGAPMSITEGIANAPPPHHTDFSPLPFTTDDSIDVGALDAATEEGPGSPTARLMRAIAPPNAAQPNSNWPPPPPNASVNLFIGRALLSNGNDNWPLKPNDIVNWIRKHYPEEWDGDEGRCSAHRVRTYLARKGADMYYEKLNQGCIAGWRIRQNHLWRFENGGFQGRGMKQEEAIANQQKENEMAVTAAHKAAAAAALAQGHPSVKTSVSSTNAEPANKRARKSVNGTARRRRKDDGGLDLGGNNGYGGYGDHSFTQQDYSLPDHSAISAEGLGQTSGDGSMLNGNNLGSGSGSRINIDPSLSTPNSGGIGVVTQSDVNDLSSSGLQGSSTNATTDHEEAAQAAAAAAAAAEAAAALDASMVHQAMQAAAAAGAAAAQMDELEMGMQLPIEMQMHGGGHDDDDVDGVGGVGDAYGHHVHHHYGTAGVGSDGQFDTSGGYGYGYDGNGH